MPSIKSVNGKIFRLQYRNDFLTVFSSRTPSAIKKFAQLLIKENPGSKLIIETHPVTCNTLYHEAAAINSEYFEMKTGIANAYAICSVLGIKFHVKEKKKYTGFTQKRSRAEISYTLTFEGIETNQLLARAEAYQISFDNHIVQRIRSRCDDFYRHIYNSNIVDIVSTLFANRIRELAANDFTHNFHIYMNNREIKMQYDDPLSYFSFRDNGLTDLSTKNQRLGFALAVIDKVSFKLQDCPILGTRNDTNSHSTITNKMHLISHCDMDDECEREEFELSFEKITQYRPTQNWY